MSKKPNSEDSSPTKGGDSVHSTSDMPADEAGHASWLERLFSRMEEAVENWGLSVADTSWSRFFRGIVVPIVLWAVGIYFAVVQKIEFGRAWPPLDGTGRGWF